MTWDAGREPLVLISVLDQEDVSPIVAQPSSSTVFHQATPVDITNNTLKISAKTQVMMRRGAAVIQHI